MRSHVVDGRRASGEERARGRETPLGATRSEVSFFFRGCHESDTSRCTLRRRDTYAHAYSLMRPGTHPQSLEPPAGRQTDRDAYAYTARANAPPAAADYIKDRSC